MTELKTNNKQAFSTKMRRWKKILYYCISRPEKQKI